MVMGMVAVGMVWTVFTDVARKCVGSGNGMNGGKGSSSIRSNK